jgi:hypothetical protein
MSQGPVRAPESPAPFDPELLELPLEPELLPEPLLEPELLLEVEPPLEPELFDPPLEPELPEPPLDPELAVPPLGPELPPELEELPASDPASSPAPESGLDVSVGPHAQKIAVAEEAARRPKTHVRLLGRTCRPRLVACSMPRAVTLAARFRQKKCTDRTHVVSVSASGRRDRKSIA